MSGQVKVEILLRTHWSDPADGEDAEYQFAEVVGDSYDGVMAQLKEAMYECADVLASPLLLDPGDPG